MAYFTESPLLAATGLRKTYGAGETRVEGLRGIDLAIAQG
jgi:hypothetical protein